MSQELRQTSFSGGEFAPSLHGRSDLEKYGSALVKALNAYVTEHGNLKNRPGTVFVTETDGGAKARLVRFMFSNDQSYILELTDLLIRVIANGGTISTNAGATAWDEAVRYTVGALITYSSNVYRCIATPMIWNPFGDPNYVYCGPMLTPSATAWDSGTVYLRGEKASLAGSTYVALNGINGGTGPGVDITNWALYGVTGALASFNSVWDPDAAYSVGTRVQFNVSNGEPNGHLAIVRATVTAASGVIPTQDTQGWLLIGASTDIVTVAVPWLEADLARLKFAQSGDIVSTAHRDYEPGELRRRAHTSWEYVSARDRQPTTWRQWHQSETYEKGEIVRVQEWAWGLPLYLQSFFRSAQGSNTNHRPTLTDSTWWVAVSGLEKHLPPADVIVLRRERRHYTVYAGDLRVSTTIDSFDQVGDTSHPVKEWVWVVTAVYGDGMESVASEPLAPRATFSLAQSRKCVLYPDKPVTITWTACPGAVAYRVYRGRSGLFGYVGEAEPSRVSEGLGGGVFQDDATTPDFARRPPTARWPFGLKAWEMFKSYRPEDLILAPNNNVYRCAVGGVSGSVAPVGLNGLIADGAAVGWVKNYAYVVGNRVEHNDATYECVNNHTSSNVNGSAEEPPGPWGTGVYGNFYDYGWWEPQSSGGTISWKYLGAGGTVQWMYVAPFADYVVGQPDAVLYHEGRRFYGALGTLTGSGVDDYANFDKGGGRDDEAVTLTLASREFEEIHSLASVENGLMVLSSTGEWLVAGGGQNEPISPVSAIARKGGNRGSSWLDPLSIGEAMVYVQPRGGRVRELLWDGGQGRYAGADLSIFSRHLFSGKEVVSWDYQATPDSIVWVVLDDGTMASLTYHREHQMAAWTHHEFPGGFVESVCVIPENGKDVVYLVVKRTVSTVVTRIIERLADRDIDPADTSTWIFLDSSKSYNGAPATVFSGLEHLEGLEVWALADGVPSGPYTVASGDVTLPTSASKVTIGLLYDVDIETLPFPQERGKQKIIAKTVLEVESTAVQFQAGETLATMSSFTPTEAGLITRDVQIRAAGSWNLKGSAAMRITSPTPLTIHAIRREVEGGGR